MCSYVRKKSWMVSVMACTGAGPWVDVHGESEFYDFSTMVLNPCYSYKPSFMRVTVMCSNMMYVIIISGCQGPIWWPFQFVVKYRIIEDTFTIVTWLPVHFMPLFPNFWSVVSYLLIKRKLLSYSLTNGLLLPKLVVAKYREEIHSYCKVKQPFEFICSEGVFIIMLRLAYESPGVTWLRSFETHCYHLRCTQILAQGAQRVVKLDGWMWN